MIRISIYTNNLPISGKVYRMPSDLQVLTSFEDYGCPSDPASGGLFQQMISGHLLAGEADYYIFIDDF